MLNEHRRTFLARIRIFIPVHYTHVLTICIVISQRNNKREIANEPRQTAKEHEQGRHNETSFRTSRRHNGNTEFAWIHSDLCNLMLRRRNTYTEPTILCPFGTCLIWQQRNSTWNGCHATTHHLHNQQFWIFLQVTNISRMFRWKIRWESVTMEYFDLKA